MRPALLSKSFDEIKRVVSEFGGSEHHAFEISKWLYKKNAIEFEEIKSIPISLKESLAEKYIIGKYRPIEVIESSDGSRKSLFTKENGLSFETVYMPSQKRKTLCISTQSGCRMGCSFCLTGKIGFKGSLSALDIINQIFSTNEYKLINRIVIMGMGEPFDNFEEVKKAVTILTSNWGTSFGASNITISTVGLIEPLKAFLNDPFCNLAISLSNPLHDERVEIMPIERTNPIVDVVDLIKKHPLRKPLRVSFEYVALSRINISENHAVAIANLLNGIKCHLNIIRWNEHESSNYKTPTNIELNRFIDCLNANGVLTSIRQSRGQDIGAACGQMAGKANKSIS